MRALPTIPVVTGPPTLAGRLYAHYETDALILWFRSSHAPKPVLAFTVDGRVHFDCSEGGVVTSVMVNIRREEWRRTEIEQWRNDLPEADIVVDQTLKSRAVTGPVEVSWDPNRSAVIVGLSRTPWDTAVALSVGCVALLAGSTLAGLFVRELRTMSTPFTFGASIEGVSI